MRIKSLFTPILLIVALIFIMTPIQSFASEKTVEDQNQKTSFLALDKSLETQKLKKHARDGKIKLNPDKPLILNFDDGSRIEYELSVSDNNSFGKSDGLQPFNGNRTYSVTKNYFKGLANLRVTLHTKVNHLGRSVTIKDVYAQKSGTYASWSNNGTRVIRRTGENNTYAISESYGDYALSAPSAGNYYNGSWRIQALIDPAGDAYLKVIY